MEAVQFRWLGTAGIELRANGQTLVIDPYLTRVPARRIWFGRLEPNHELIAEKIQHCDSILTTHAHFDHIMDVPDVVRNTGATALGSPNTCRLLSACGVPEERIREIKAGDRLTLNDCQMGLSAAATSESGRVQAGH